jgi:hypothetical protein
MKQPSCTPFEKSFPAPFVVPRPRSQPMALLLQFRPTCDLSANVHERNEFPLWISGVAIAVKCPRSSSCFTWMWTESTMVGVGTHTMAATAIYADGNAGFVNSTTTDSTAPLLTTRGTYPSSVSRREEATTARKHLCFISRAMSPALTNGNFN